MKEIMHMKKSILVAALLAGFPMLSFADASLGSDPAVGVKLTTLGLGLDYSFAIDESFGGRVGVNYYKRNIDRTWNDNPAHGDVKLSTVNLLADWYPAHDSLRVTAGFMINNNKVYLSRTRSSGTVDVTEFGHVDFRKLSPYLGVGWTGRKKDQHLVIAADVGVMFQGNPRTSVTSTVDANTPLTNAGCGSTVAECLASDNASLYDDLKKYRYWPVAGMSVSYSF